VPCSMQLDKERVATSAPECQAGVLVVRRHHALVRCSHWLNVRILLGLILSGVSIYWASPVYRHEPDPLSGDFDALADVGIWICAHIPGLHQYSSPPDWVYNHIGLDPGMLAAALRLHWLCAYLFMLNGLIFAIGLAMGGGWRSLLPRRTDLRDALDRTLPGRKGMFGMNSPQSGVLGFGLLQDGNVRVGVFPEREEVFVSGERPDASGVSVSALRSPCL
jgi:hypothetical protein